MITTPSMGLTRWDQPNDVFSYTQLSDNFAALDGHDHTSTKGVQIPTGGIANLAVDATKLANDAVTTAKLLNANVTDAKLASPNNGSWRTVLQTNFKTASSEVNGTVYIPLATSGGILSASGTTTNSNINTLPFYPTHYSVAGKTLQLRLTIGGMTNSVVPAFNLTADLRPVSSAGGTIGGVNYVVGSAVSGSTVTVSGMTSSSSYQGTATFTPPAQGLYTLGITVSATPASGSGTAWMALLQYAHV